MSPNDKTHREAPGLPSFVLLGNQFSMAENICMYICGFTEGNGCHFETDKTFNLMSGGIICAQFLAIRQLHFQADVIVYGRYDARYDGWLRVYAVCFLFNVCTLYTGVPI